MDEIKFKKYDLASRFFLGIVGLMITLILGVSQFNLQKVQANSIEEEKKDKKRFQILDIVNDNLPYYSDTSAKGKIARSIINNSASILSKDFDFSELADLLDQTISSDSTLQRSISVDDLQVISNATSKQNQPEEEWFCVIASYSINKLNRAQSKSEKANKTLKEIGSKIKSRIYLTTQSGVYAVTLGGKLSKRKAIDYVGIARNKGIASDAFYQKDKDWKLIEE